MPFVSIFWDIPNRHTKLDKECWFGEQYSNFPTDFGKFANRNTKRGALKSEKALSKYKFNHVFFIIFNKNFNNSTLIVCVIIHFLCVIA